MGLLLYSRRVFGGRKASFFVASLVALCFFCLPIWPERETSSVELRTQQVRNTGNLLGEGARGPETPPPDAPASPDPSSAKNMTLTVPKLGLKDVAVPTGSRQAELDRAGVLRMKESGLPWEEGSNTFIAGHALGYSWTRVPRAFYDLEKLMPGDEIFLKDADRETYTFRVYDRMTVEPDDTWVTYPVEGKTTVSLQTCVPIPTFENRLIVRGELVS
ncbi:sortase [Rubrobacter tropicus]|uniref:Sortase n=1 Tax=Rubrobacter tropicus TaxID=2653851 RepID=A0A6G8QDV8_9ACTN|nr:class E sortase [Rubrobacter tropicus]QIN84690.1 sortase [Rubrobacter tropicus]